MSKRIVELDSQVLNAMQSCQELWNLQFLQNWRSNHAHEPFEKGDLGHIACQHYYTGISLFQAQGKEHPDKLELIREAVSHAAREGHTQELPVQEVDRICRIMERYFHYYLPIDNFKILAVEQPFSKILYEDDSLQIIYTGVLDLVVDDIGLGKHAPMDHKTQSRHYYIHQMDNQFIGYAWALDTNWAIPNKVGLQKTTKDEDRFKRQILPISDDLKEIWIKNTIRTVKNAIKSFDEKDFEFNLSHCKMWGGCEFRNICPTKDSEIKRYKLMTDFYVGKPWNPYTKG